MTPTPGTLLFQWRCTACPKDARVTVQTSEDVAPLCPTCGKTMKTSDCCGVGSSERHQAEGLGFDRFPNVSSLKGVEMLPKGFTMTTHIDRRLDETEKLVSELTSRLYPVVVGDLETEIVDDTSPMGERIERINAALGRLLGGLDLP